MRRRSESNTCIASWLSSLFMNNDAYALGSKAARVNGISEKLEYGEGWEICQHVGKRCYRKRLD